MKREIINLIDLYENHYKFKYATDSYRRGICATIPYADKELLEKLCNDILKREETNLFAEVEADYIIRIKEYYTLSTDLKCIYLYSTRSYRAIDIYYEIMKAINIIDDKKTIALRQRMLCNSLNSIYGIGSASYDREYLGKFQKVYGPSLKYKNNCYVKFDIDEHTIPAIKKVISNKPYSIVLWEDGTKTIVKQQPGETKYDPEKGLAMCIVKKMYGNNKWYDIFKRNLDPKYTKRKKVK